jgi:hypothetical protein
MQFFQPPERRRPPEQMAPPAWIAPPVHEVGVPLPVNDVVARSDAAVVALRGLLAFTNGFQLVVAARVRDADPWLDVLGHRGGPAWERTDLPDTVLRLGIELPDGTRATSLERPVLPMGGEPPALSIMVGGGGGGAVWDFQCWIWPLPPPEAFDLVCEWPGLGIPLTRHPLDGAAIRAAAARSTPLWEPGATP